MTLKNDGGSQQTAAAKSGISTRSGRRIEREPVAKPRGIRRWRTRPDPLVLVWDSELVPLLRREPSLTGLSLLEHLQDHFPDQYDQSVLRTLQRRVLKWRAIEGPEQEVMFLQRSVPGALGLSDFTHAKLAIMIGGRPFAHRLYQFRLRFSGCCISFGCALVAGAAYR